MASEALSVRSIGRTNEKTSGCGVNPLDGCNYRESAVKFYYYNPLDGSLIEVSNHAEIQKPQ